MSLNEEQEEEREVLLSIYDGDNCFKALNETTYQYRIGESGHHKSFLLEISWGDDYPSTYPTISLDTFFNNHLSHCLKATIISRIREEAEQWLDSAMTFTLFEFAKENAESLMAAQEESSQAKEEEVEGREENIQTAPQVEKSKQRKEQLTKAQKRKLTDRTNYKGERPRGWDWVDVVKHLSKTGAGKPDS